MFDPRMDLGWIVANWDAVAQVAKDIYIAIAPAINWLIVKYTGAGKAFKPVRRTPRKRRRVMKAAIEKKEYIDVIELARRLNVPRQTLSHWARHGVIPAFRMSHRVQRFIYEDVVAALEAHGEQAVEEISKKAAARK